MPTPYFWAYIRFLCLNETICVVDGVRGTKYNGRFFRLTRAAYLNPNSSSSLSDKLFLKYGVFK
jgi:hypothetical protein